MTTYNLITVEETTASPNVLSSTTYTVPVDGNNIPVTDYLIKNRVIQGNQMFVFDTEQEYRDWINQNT